MEKIRLGVSACLLGQKVRYDGGHKWDRYLTGTLGRYLQLVPVCPEVELGLGVPREATRLEGDPASPRLVTVETRVDRTEAMRGWAQGRVKGLERQDLCGFIFKSRSPSCGLAGLPVYGPKGRKRGVGLFAQAFVEHFPGLPVMDEVRLHDPDLRENFIQRLFVCARWRELLKRPSLGRLTAFHTRHRLQLMSHSPRHLRLLEKLLAPGKAVPLPELCRQYQELLFAALKLKATPGKDTKVLYHLLAQLKKSLSADEKQELVESIENYRQGAFPLLVPVSLINHYVRQYGQVYLKEQFYLHPHPLELMLRHHA